MKLPMVLRQRPLVQRLGKRHSLISDSIPEIQAEINNQLTCLDSAVSVKIHSSTLNNAGYTKILPVDYIKII